MSVEGYTIQDGWSPADALKRPLMFLLFSKEEQESLLGLYLQFRDPQPSVPLPTVEVSLPHSELKDRIEETDLEKMDQIARDFISQVLLRTRLKEIYSRDGLEGALQESFLGEYPTPMEAEVLDDFIRSLGVEFKTDPERLFFTMFSDLPKRTDLSGLGLPLEWVVDTANFSRYVRRIEVDLQNGAGLDADLQRVPPAAYGLPEWTYISGTGPLEVVPLVREIVLCQELRLWDTQRGEKLPPVPTREIAAWIGTDYTEVLKAQLNADGLHRQPYQRPLKNCSPSIYSLLKAEVKSLIKFKEVKR